MYRDYGPKKVKFYFVYKSLAHPELVDHHVQPFTLDERLKHAQLAEKKLAATIPWVVDPIDNRLKHAMGDRPNSEFIIDPEGKIVRKRAWSHPAEVRRDLEKLVGPVDKITREEDIKLKIELPPKEPAPRGTTPALVRPRMQAIVMKPRIEPKGLPFYAKLRVEADNALMNDGAGKLYLGFHLDPIHGAHWNNLSDPLKYKLEVPKGVKVKKFGDSAPEPKAASDCDPREFMVDVEAWPKGETVRLTVTYFACVGETTCHRVVQEYDITLERDRDGGGARGEGAGLWEPEQFAKQMLARDKNGDGKLDATEVMGLIRPHFAHFDKNKDGLLDSEELKAVSDWLNYHHQPGAPATPPKKK